MTGGYVAPEVALAVERAIPDHDRVPDPLPAVLAAVPPHLVAWLTECNPRPAKKEAS